MKTYCRCDSKNCLCEYPITKQVLKNRSKKSSQNSSTNSSGDDTYSDPYYYYKTETIKSNNTISKALYPYSVNVRPNIYYDEPAATYSDEGSNLYYKLTHFDDKIKQFITGQLSYTKNRDYFEKVEQLRFRLPTADQLELKSEIPAAVIDARVDAMIKFREQHTDECRGTRTVREDKDKHTCVHRYFLNDRQFPQPSLTDEDGNSLCSSCYTASNYMMENNVSPLNCEKRFVVPGSADSVVSKGNTDDAPILVLEAPQSGVSQSSFFDNSTTNLKFVPFSNSLALRFQPRRLC